MTAPTVHPSLLPPPPTPSRSLARWSSPLWLSLAEARPLVQAIVVLRFATGVLLVGRGAWPATATWAPVLLTGGAWVLAHTAVYLFNGLRDVATDRANGGARPLARGALDPRAARVVCAGLVAAAGLAALAVSPVVLALVAVLLLAGAVYSAPPSWLRRTATPYVGVAVGGGGTYLAAALAVGSSGSLALVCFGTVMTAWMVLVGAVLKDLADVEGDRVGGRRTPAIRWGVHRSARFGSRAATALGLALGVAAVALPHCGVLLAPAGCLLAAALVIDRRAGQVAVGNRASARAPYRTFMVGQYAAHGALWVALGL